MKTGLTRRTALKSIAAALGGVFIFLALRVLSQASDESARRMFGFSVLYLFLLFALLIVDRAPGLVPLGLMAPELVPLGLVVGGLG